MALGMRNYRGIDGQGIQHEGEISEICTGLWLGKPKGKGWYMWENNIEMYLKT
jgi:hypothetical protein